jgi:hypothetical protein
MELAADGDVDKLPVTLAYDLKSAYNNVKRAQMFAQAHKRFPTMLRFLNLVYGQAGTLYFTSNGHINDYFFCTEGVLQGCQLGLHGLCLALWDFLDELSDVINRNDASGVWIADDLTIVVTRDRAEHIVRTCQVEFPQYGMETSPGKLFAYMPGPPQSRISDMLRQNGFRVSDQGLQRLLGAPIGSHEFKIRSASEGGHLQLLTDDAISFVRAASQVRHVQARYHLLRWSAATLLLHLGRLIPPNVLLGYATQFQNALDLSVKALLASDSLTPLQLAITRLPTRHGGMGLGGPLGIMRQAYAASAGAVARFLTKVRGWGERLRLLARLRSSPHIISVSAGLNDDFRKTENGQKLLLNPAQIEIWPTQSAMSRALLSKQADGIEEDLSCWPIFHTPQTKSCAA